MSRSDDDATEHVYATQGAGAGRIALGAILGGSGIAYVRELRAAVAQLFGRRSFEEALREEQARA